MKRFVIIVVAALFASCSAPHKFAPPSVAPVREKIANAQEHVANAQTHAGLAKIAVDRARAIAPAELNDLRQALDLASAEIDSLTDELLHAQTALHDAQLKLDTLEKRVGEQTEKLNAATEAARVAIGKYHLLKFYFCLIAAAAVFLVVFYFRKVLIAIPPPFSIYAGAAAFAGLPAATFGALWFRL
jgi:hypothetical protein